jgi:hypothetical protein
LTHSRSRYGFTAEGDAGRSYDTQVVLDILYAGHGVRQIFGATLDHSAGDRSGERDFPTGDIDFDIGHIEHAVIGQAVVDVLLYAGIGSDIASWSPATMLVALASSPGVLVTER